MKKRMLSWLILAVMATSSVFITAGTSLPPEKDTDAELKPRLTAQSDDYDLSVYEDEITLQKGKTKSIDYYFSVDIDDEDEIDYWFEYDEYDHYWLTVESSNGRCEIKDDDSSYWDDYQIYGKYKGNIKVRGVKYGTDTLIVRVEDSDNDEVIATHKIKVKVEPPKVSVKSLTSPKKKWLKVAWETVKGISGYELQVSESKGFKKGKQKTVKPSAKEKSVTMSGLKPGKTYYVRMRTYDKEGSKKVYSSWSKTKTVKIK